MRLLVAALIVGGLGVPVSTSPASAAGTFPSMWTVSVDYSHSFTSPTVTGTATLKATFNCDVPPPTADIGLFCPTMVSVQASSDAQSQNGDCHTTWTYQTFDRVVDFPVVDLIPTSPGSDAYTYSPPVVEVELSGTNISVATVTPRRHDVTTLVANSCGPSNCRPPDQQFTLGSDPNVMIEGTFPFTVPSGTGTFSGTSGWTITGTIDCAAAASGAQTLAAASHGEILAAALDAGTCCPKATVASPPVRNADTPKGMPDRIPPRTATTIQVQANIPTCRVIVVSADGPSDAGTARIGGQKTFTLPAVTNTSVPLSVTGDTQTDVGVGAKLLVVATDITDSAHPTPIATSHSFAVSAIPVNWHSTFLGEIDPINSIPSVPPRWPRRHRHERHLGVGLR